MRKPLFVGNWKMNLTGPEATELTKKLTLAVGDLGNVEVAIAPAFTSLRPVSSIISASSLPATLPPPVRNTLATPMRPLPNSRISTPLRILMRM